MTPTWMRGYVRAYDREYIPLCRSNRLECLHVRVYVCVCLPLCLSFCLYVRLHVFLHVAFISLTV